MNTKDKLEEKIKEIIYEVGYMDRDYRKSLNKATKQIKALLTSEVERERERLLKEVEEKVIGMILKEKGEEVLTDEGKGFNKALNRVNKALSDIGGGKNE